MTKKILHAKKPPFSFGHFFGRFHAIIFTICAGGGLTVAVFLLMNILTSSSVPDDYTPPVTDASFDTHTIERVETLRTLDVKPSSPKLPSGRTDPFPQ